VIWSEPAACAGAPEKIFFPAASAPDSRRPTQPDYRAAAQYCSRCPAIMICAADILTYEQGRAAYQRFGYAAGMTPQQRAQLDPTSPERKRVQK